MASYVIPSKIALDGIKDPKDLKGFAETVAPRDRLIPRAYELADYIMSRPRPVRRLTTQIVRRPRRQRIANDSDGGFGIQMFGHLSKKAAVHRRDHIENVVECVRQGGKNGLDRA
jgi:hypothetical protein